MKHFTDELESRLHAAAETHAAQGPARSAARSVAAAPKRIGGVAVLAAAAIGLMIAVGSGRRSDDALAFPVLSHPAVDASNQPDVDVLRRAGADLRQTRTFETPYGLGYVAEAPGGRLCVAAPDKVPGAMAGTCQKTSVAESHGMWLTFTGSEDVSESDSEFIAILPAGAQAPRATMADGTSTALVVRDGVVVARFTEDVTVTLDVNDQQTKVSVPLGQPERGRVADCGNGRIVTQARGQSYEQACER